MWLYLKKKQFHNFHLRPPYLKQQKIYKLVQIQFKLFSNVFKLFSVGRSILHFFSEQVCEHNHHFFF